MVQQVVVKWEVWRGVLRKFCCVSQLVKQTSNRKISVLGTTPVTEGGDKVIEPMFVELCWEGDKGRVVRGGERKTSRHSILCQVHQTFYLKMEGSFLVGYFRPGVSSSHRCYLRLLNLSFL